MIAGMEHLELSRRNALLLLRADVEFAREVKREQAERERRAEERLELAQRQAQAHFAEFGEWPHETAVRMQAAAEVAERREREQRMIARAEQRQAMEAQWMMQGRQPRSVGEVLALAAMWP